MARSCLTPLCPAAGTARGAPPRIPEMVPPQNAPPKWSVRLRRPGQTANSPGLSFATGRRAQGEAPRSPKLGRGRDGGDSAGGRSGSLPRARLRTPGRLLLGVQEAGPLRPGCRPGLGHDPRLGRGTIGPGAEAAGCVAGEAGSQRGELGSVSGVSPSGLNLTP